MAAASCRCWRFVKLKGLYRRGFCYSGGPIRGIIWACSILLSVYHYAQNPVCIHFASLRAGRPVTPTSFAITVVRGLAPLHDSPEASFASEASPYPQRPFRGLTIAILHCPLPWCRPGRGDGSYVGGRIIIHKTQASCESAVSFCLLSGFQGAVHPVCVEQNLLNLAKGNEIGKLDRTYVAGVVGLADK